MTDNSPQLPPPISRWTLGVLLIINVAVVGFVSGVFGYFADYKYVMAPFYGWLAHQHDTMDYYQQHIAELRSTPDVDLDRIAVAKARLESLRMTKEPSFRELPYLAVGVPVGFMLGLAAAVAWWFSMWRLSLRSVRCGSAPKPGWWKRRGAGRAMLLGMVLTVVLHLAVGWTHKDAPRTVFTKILIYAPIGVAGGAILGWFGAVPWVLVDRKRWRKMETQP